MSADACKTKFSVVANTRFLVTLIGRRRKPDARRGFDFSQVNISFPRVNTKYSRWLVEPKPLRFSLTYTNQTNASDPCDLSLMEFELKNSNRARPRRTASAHSPKPSTELPSIPANLVDRKTNQADWPTDKLGPRSTSASAPIVRCQTKAIGDLLSAKTQTKQQQYQKLGTYANESRRPIVCLLFVLPLVIFYEIGLNFPRKRIAAKWHRSMVPSDA